MILFFFKSEDREFFYLLNFPRGTQDFNFRKSDFIISRFLSLGFDISF